ncbi:hypothetical protein [Pseudomonas fluorescens]|uniref:hypothetical protein n=1 Tax=Pseudomonas fluorescens TaxID=294 RepID=UPI000A429882|nr:hypothetical protein [Pseudomonas fluorescens]
MRFIDRSSVPEPSSLKDPSDAVRREKEAALRYYTASARVAGEKLTSYTFTEYSAGDVTTTLRRLFNNKCAYCEGYLSDDVDIEHFRPKGGITEDGTHDGYWWLTHSWTNLLASCKHCNQSRYNHLVAQHATVADVLKLQATTARTAYGKANQFPIQGLRATYTASDLDAEQALLIDPTAENPAPYFEWSREGHYSVVLPRPTDDRTQARGLAAINVFALNRLYLVKDRTERLNELRTHAQSIVQSLEKDMRVGGSQECLDEALERVRILRTYHNPSKRHTAMVEAFVDEFVAALRDRVASNAQPVAMNSFMPHPSDEDEIDEDT